MTQGLSGLATMTSCAAMAASLALPLVPTGAHAQEAPAPAQTGRAGTEASAGDIVVTARRREENLLETPIAISAFTGEALEERGIKNLQDLGSFVPGLNIVGQATGGGARADRSFVGVILRGMQPSTSSAQTTSMFIDGVPVSQATALQVLTNPARVEVLKGPQSATFGRQTFAGAINVVTKDPSDTLTGQMSGMVGTRANYDVSGELSGPLLGDILGFRATARAFGKHGSYKNAANPNETLGDQSSKAATLALKFTPTSNLTIKGFGLYSKLSDGPAANGYISAYGLTDDDGNVIRQDQSNCNVTGSSGVTTRWFCGTAPSLSRLSPQADTANTAFITNFLKSDQGRLFHNDLDGYGLRNDYYHIHLDANWDIGDTGLALHSLTGWNTERKNELADLDNYNGANDTGTGSLYPDGTYNFVYYIEAESRDFSQELRLSYDKGGPLQATVGASYLNARAQSASGSPNLSGTRRYGATQSKTYGFFTSINYDVTEALSLAFDGRYQIDKLYAYAGEGGVTSTGATIPAGFYAEDEEIAQGTYKNFLPRVIAQYTIGESMLYASYSKGVNPGAFNTLFITAIPEVVQAAESYGYKVKVDPEKITNYEIGLKGHALGNLFTYELAAFLADWTNQIQSQSTQINVDTNGDGVLEPYQVSGSTNTGKVRVKGIEASVSTRLSTALNLDLSGAYIDSEILKAVNTGVTALTGITDFHGNQSPFVSKWSGTAALNYQAPISAALDGFARLDFMYKSGTYSDVSNLVKSPDLTQTNVRAGIRNETYSIEAFVTNLFNNKAYYSISDNSLIMSSNSSPNSSVYGGLVAQLRELRTIGIRGTFNF
ncbi:TonB-dependent receptor [Novosphingobium profundi]|uniref:TonB-dependent receptor n=1 Tax=Novosphingobium profundi TaxID=1774954 RepID=UPI001BD9AF95|nr:TonB-dependent receptor [Novosphingobium profundi]MBT0669549.1 TonB-dependent receptor [Novosphingobium profundi]